MSHIEDLKAINHFTDSLPGDRSLEPGVRQVEGACYSLVSPTRVAKPAWISWSEKLAKDFGLKSPSEKSLEILSGNLAFPKAQPFAACYGGHQFGNWAGQLGDGRAITIAEIPDRNERLWELQLKGAGLTPYSRNADGRAVLRSSLREYLASEAMHALGVPTTRALSLVGTGESVVRDILYSGHPAAEPGAVVARLAPSFLRFGSFEIFASRGDAVRCRQLLDYIIVREFPDIDIDDPDRDGKWFVEVCRRTALLISEWMRVGFVHGVMNTDNMSVLGLTIDYGPFGWLESYDPDFTPNTTDLPGRRYCFGRQPAIGHWNLNCLANALHFLGEEKEPLEHGLKVYQEVFQSSFEEMMTRKLGLRTYDENLLVQFFQWMKDQQADYTLFFSELAEFDLEENSAEHCQRFLERVCYTSDPSWESFQSLVNTYSEAVRSQQVESHERLELMEKTNPKYVLRNWQAYQAIEAAEKGDYDPLRRLEEVLNAPYAKHSSHSEFAQKRPDWAADKPGCSMLSCSS